MQVYCCNVWVWEIKSSNCSIEDVFSFDHFLSQVVTQSHKLVIEIACNIKITLHLKFKSFYRRHSCSRAIFAVAEWLMPGTTHTPAAGTDCGGSAFAPSRCVVPTVCGLRGTTQPLPTDWLAERRTLWRRYRLTDPCMRSWRWGWRFELF